MKLRRHVVRLPAEARGSVDVEGETLDSRLRTFAATIPSRLDVPLAEAYTRAGGGGELLAAVRALLARGGVPIAPPGPSDYILLLRGVPVAPWIPLRPAAEVWAAWLRRLEELWAEWSSLLAVPATPPASESAAVAPADWEVWQREHILAVEMRHTVPGTQRLATLLADRRLDQADVHLVGHSVGGATLLAYLAGWRAGLLPPPRAHLRAVITLDAAIAGIGGIWSGARSYLASRTSAGLLGLGEWATQRGIALLTASNERDLWSHRAISDLPYLGLRLGPPFALRAQLDGTIHGWLRRTPQLVEALWGSHSGQQSAEPTQAPA